MAFRSLIQCTTELENDSHTAHRLSVRLRVELDNSSFDPFGPQTEATVVALRALADFIEETLAGPPIKGNAAILLDNSAEPIREDQSDV